MCGQLNRVIADTRIRTVQRLKEVWQDKLRRKLEKGRRIRQETVDLKAVKITARPQQEGNSLSMRVLLEIPASFVELS